MADKEILHHVIYPHKAPLHLEYSMNNSTRERVKNYSQMGTTSAKNFSWSNRVHEVGLAKQTELLVSFGATFGAANRIQTGSST